MSLAIRFASKPTLVGMLLALAGCQEHPPMPAPDREPAAIQAGADFNPATAGSIHGTVTWAGPVPDVPAYEVLPNPLAGRVFQAKHPRANPTIPIIDSNTHALAETIVFLKGIDARVGKPWDLPPATVEMRDVRFQVLQGESSTSVGFVRRGDSIRMVSREDCFHSLRAGGAAFFSYTFPDADSPLRRRLDKSGLVELSSGCGYYWMRAYLFVDDHPYYTRTDRHGRFRFDRVPPGKYEVAAWLPSWQTARHERDPESGLISRLILKSPLTSQVIISLSPRGSQEARLKLGALIP